MQDYISLDKHKYHEICSILDISSKLDRKATKILHKAMNTKTVQKTIEQLEQLMKNKTVFIFGAGPSLEESIDQHEQLLSEFKDDIVIVAVDGAANALYVNNIEIDVVVSDLDGCFRGIKEELFSESIVVIHGHGNNIEKIRQLGLQLKKAGFIGTTQGKETRRIKNFGGFSDGDRAVHLAANFGASKIIIFGFDFGTIVGRFSKPESLESNAKTIKLQKFTIAKELLGELPSKFPLTQFYNATIKGEKLKNFEVIEQKDLESIISK